MVQSMELSLVFRLCGELYALPAADVLKVVEPGPVSRLPRLPAAILGISHYRGRVLTVVDLAVLILGRADAVPPAQGRLILMERSGSNVALWAGSVADLVALDRTQSSPPLRASSLVLRVHLHQGHAVGVLHTEHLLSRIAKLCPSDPLHRRETPSYAG
jgi:chemotaxis signal transduction protein